MTVQYAKSYIDRALDSNDVSTLYDVIHVLDGERELAEPLRLFLRFWEWTCSTRSGIWQYYENVRLSDFEEIVWTVTGTVAWESRPVIAGDFRSEQMQAFEVWPDVGLGGDWHRFLGKSARHCDGFGQRSFAGVSSLASCS